MSTMLSPTVHLEQGVTVVTLGPDYHHLEEPMLATLSDQLAEVPLATEPPRVVLDLSHTTYFGSAFLEVLLRLWDRIHVRHGGQLVLSGVTAYCREVLSITHLDTLWHLYPDTRTAVSALQDS